MKPADVKSISYINSSEKIMVKILNLKLEIRLEYQNINFFLQKSMFQIGLKTRLWLKKKKLKTLCFGYMLLLVILTKKNVLEHSTEKNWENQIKKSSEFKN